MSGQPRRFVIIGNGVAGTTAAETIRKAEADAEVVLIGAEPYPLYNRVALPPFLKGRVSEDKVLMRSRQTHEEQGISLHLETRVARVDLENHVVITDDDRVFPFDKLLVATGGRPNALPVEGSNDIRYIYNFHTLDDTKEITGRIHDSKEAVVVGGSYIAYELAEGFRARGLETTWIIRGPRFLRRLLDEQGGQLVDLIAKDHGVNVIYDSEIAEVHHSAGAVTGVTTSGGVRIEADIVGVGLGLTLNTDFVQDAGLVTGYGIRTDEFMQTSHPDVFAAGDVAEFYDRITGSHHTMGTWNTSVSHGKTAGQNMMGGQVPYETVPTYTSGLFDSKLAVLGATPEISQDLTSVESCNLKERTYKRLFFLNSRLVGAVLIGDMSPRRRILQLIRQGEKIDNPKALLTT